MGKNVQQPGGPVTQEDAVLGLVRQIRVDTTNWGLRLHDEVTPGGHKIPNEERVKEMIQTGGDTDSSTQGINYLASLAELQDHVPKPNALAVLAANGLEDMFLWRTGANDGSGVSSNVSGWWQRLDSRLGFYARLWRAGAINLQFNGAAPGANQDITAWADNGTVKLWDGAAYQVATPALFTRLLSKIGNYAGTIILPDQLAEILVASADLNLETKTGWKKSSAADANAPSATVSPVFTFYFDANNAYQTFYVQNGSGDSWQRTKAGGAWGAWKFLMGALVTRLEAIGAATTDANTALDSGWYPALSTASNLPSAVNGMVQTLRRTSTEAIQFFYSSAGNAAWMRRYVASVWQAWVPIYPADMAVATGTLSRANVGITTISQAEAEAGTATTDRIFTAERVKQAIQIWWGTGANYLANVANKVMTAAAVWAAAVPVNLGGALTGNLTLDFATFINGYGTTSGNITFNATSNLKLGQSGMLTIINGASHTLTLNTTYFESGNGSGIVLSSGRNQIAYYIGENSKVFLTQSGKAVA